VKSFILFFTFLPFLSFGQNHDLDINFGGLHNSGNSTLTQINSTINYTLKYKSSEVSNRFNYLYVSQVGQKTQRECYYWINPKISYKNFTFFLQNEVLTNSRRNIDLRVGPGGGVEYHFIKNDSTSLSNSLALMYENTNYSDVKIGVTRLSYRIKGKIERGNVKFTSEIWFQPDIFSFSKIKGLSINQLTVNVGKGIGLIAKYEVYYEQFNTQGALPLDQRMSLGLNYKIKK